jgi:hypothetical protein
MVNEAFKKDLNKFVANSTASTELPAGSPRRYEPEMGISKHNEKIHRENSHSTRHQNLPFTFSKPVKNKPTIVKVCSSCDSPVYVHKNCVGIVCRTCGIYSTVKEIEYYG